MVDSSASLKPKVRKKTSTPSTTNRSVSPPGQARREHVGQELALYQAVVGLQGQEEGGHADGEGADAGRAGGG